MAINRDGQAPDIYQGVNPVNRPANIVAQRAPVSTDKGYPVSTLWVDKANDAAYQLTSVAANVANWEVLGSAVGAVATLTGDSGGALSPAAGNLNILTGDNLTAAGGGSTITVSLDEGMPAQASVTLTAAEVKALRAAPISIVAAPGAGKMVQILGGQLKLVYGSEVFVETADNLALRFTDGTGAIVSQTVETTGFLDQSADTISNVIPIVDAIVVATGAENQALVIHNTGDGEITGNASDDSTLIVNLLYRVITLA